MPLSSYGVAPGRDGDARNGFGGSGKLATCVMVAFLVNRRLKMWPVLLAPAVPANSTTQTNFNFPRIAAYVFVGVDVNALLFANATSRRFFNYSCRFVMSFHILALSFFCFAENSLRLNCKTSILEYKKKHVANRTCVGNIYRSTWSGCTW